MNSKILMSAAAGLLALAGTAFAQGAKVEGEFSKPIKRKAAGGQAGQSGGGHSSIMMSRTDGDDTVEIRIENGKITSAKVNGKDVPDDRIKKHDGRVDILDEDGNVVQSFSVGEGGHGTWMLGEPGDGQFKVFGPEGFRFDPDQYVFTPFSGAAVAAEPPKVMLGVNMTEASEDDLADLDGVEAAIRIDRVIEDLPAAKAGLKEGDLVTAINGEKPATPEKLREILREQEPGDKVKLSVAREDGEEKTLTVTLAEYDAEKLGIQAMTMQGWEPGQMNEEARKAYEEAIKSIPHLRQGQPAPRAFGQGGRPLMLRTPAPDQDGQMNAHLRDLDKRLEAIDERLRELDERLERLTTRLEKLADRP